jgi:hypothetical protein
VHGWHPQIESKQADVVSTQPSRMKHACTAAPLLCSIRAEQKHSIRLDRRFSDENVFDAGFSRARDAEDAHHHKG